jgi:pimeloyl-ACP methyl ester carboxylesterase
VDNFGPILDGVADELVGIAVGAGVERFAVLGYSLGTGVAVRIATRHPGRVTDLMLTSGFAYPVRDLRLALDIWRTLLGTDLKSTAKFLMSAATGRTYLNSSNAAELPGISVPALVIATTEDKLASVTLSRKLAEGIPKAEPVEIDTGHNIVAEARDEWLGAISEFLDGID